MCVEKKLIFRFGLQGKPPTIVEMAKPLMQNTPNKIACIHSQVQLNDARIRQINNRLAAQEAQLTRQETVINLLQIQTNTQLADLAALEDLVAKNRERYAHRQATQWLQQFEMECEMKRKLHAAHIEEEERQLEQQRLELISVEAKMQDNQRKMEEDERRKDFELEKYMLESSHDLAKREQDVMLGTLKLMLGAEGIDAGSI